MSLARAALMIGVALATGACATYGLIENKPLAHADPVSSRRTSTFRRAR